MIFRLQVHEKALSVKVGRWGCLQDLRAREKQEEEGISGEGHVDACAYGKKGFNSSLGHTD